MSSTTAEGASTRGAWSRIRPIWVGRVIVLAAAVLLVVYPLVSDDLYHQNIEETDVPAAIRSPAGRVAHVQVCGNDRGTPGTDHLDWPAILTAVDATGYAGPLCIESFTAENATIATAASIWRPLAESQDAIAVDGLTFLRTVMP